MQHTDCSHLCITLPFTMAHSALRVNAFCYTYCVCEGALKENCSMCGLSYDNTGNNLGISDPLTMHCVQGIFSSPVWQGKPLSHRALCDLW